MHLNYNSYKVLLKTVLLLFARTSLEITHSGSEASSEPVHHLKSGLRCTVFFFFFSLKHNLICEFTVCFLMKLKKLGQNVNVTLSLEELINSI